MAWDVTKPADTDLVRNFPALHRGDKTTLQSELQVEHDVLPATGSGTGRHKFPSGDTASRPTNPVAGSIYINTELAALEQYDGAAWVPRVPGVPTGTIVAFGGSSAPAGWLLCDGSAVSRTTYANLFNVIGTAYGVGDGSTTFNVPNLKGRVPVGLDTAQGEFNARGVVGGAKTHTLSVSELPAHNHAAFVNDTVHTHSVNDPGHAHTVMTHAGGGVSGSGLTSSDALIASSTGSATTGISLNPATTGVSVSIGNTGGGAAHNNLQPYQVVNYIIKT